MYYKKIKPNLGLAWLLLCFAFLLHVIDEAVHDFLLFYNPAVGNIKENLPFLPLPTFTFENWLTMLIIVILILFFLTPLAYKSRLWIIKLANIYGIVMLLNGIIHIVGSIYRKIQMPGFPKSMTTSWTSTKA